MSQSCKRLNMERELTLMARGQEIHTLPEIIATWALDHMHALECGEMPAHSRGDSAQWLEKLYLLKDERHA